MKLTREEAIDLSIIKWEYIVENGGEFDLRTSPNKILNLKCRCGLCELYRNFADEEECGECPLRMKNLRCFDIGHIHFDWAKSHTIESAQVVLDAIKKLKEVK